jgi:hypothetical protein
VFWDLEEAMACDPERPHRRSIRLWQRNYYEHIIRDDESLNSIREYITNNPLQWEMDRENPVRALGNVPMPKDEPWRI